MAVVGYARVSAREEGQLLDRQMDASRSPAAIGSLRTVPAARVLTAFLQIQAAFAEMERLLYAQHLMAGQARSIPKICHELGDMLASKLYLYFHADGSLKAPTRRLLAPDRTGGAASAKGPSAETASNKALQAHAVA